MRRCDNGIPAFPKGERRLLNLPDCVFLTEQGRCRILRVPECAGETCSFCRSRACAEDANRRWKTRMNVLDDARQAYLLSRMEHRQTIVTACDASLFAKTDGKVYRMESGVLSEC